MLASSPSRSRNSNIRTDCSSEDILTDDKIRLSRPTGIDVSYLPLVPSVYDDLGRIIGEVPLVERPAPSYFLVYLPKEPFVAGGKERKADEQKSRCCWGL